MAELVQSMRAGSMSADSEPADAKRVADSRLTEKDRRIIDTMVTFLNDSVRHPSHQPDDAPQVPKRLLGFRVRLGTAVVAAALAFLIGVAYAGKLPGPAQNAVSVVLSKVGLSVPRHGGTEGSDDTSVPQDAAVGPDATGAAHDGLCNAYLHGSGGENGEKFDSVAFQNVKEAADAVGQSVEEFCGVDEGTSETDGDHHGRGRGRGSEHSGGDSGDHQGSGNPGNGNEGSEGQGNAKKDRGSQESSPNDSGGSAQSGSSDSGGSNQSGPGEGGGSGEGGVGEGTSQAVPTD